MSPSFDNIQTTDRGCVEDQPQKGSIFVRAYKVYAIGIRPLLRLVSDTTAVQFLLPTSVK